MKSKKVGEIFSDYKTNSNIKYAEVRALNVIKKTNTLQVLLYFDEYIEIKEIWYFEKFLREKFMFLSVDIKIEYYEAVEKKDIKTEWRNIIAYMAHKYPLTKPMLLLKSDIDVVEKNIIVRMHIKGADFLKAKKTDKELAQEQAQDDDADPFLMDAIQTVVETGQASTSFIQRRFKVGYARAGRIIDQMEERGVISGYQGSKPREVLMSLEKLNELKMSGDMQTEEKN